MDPFDEDRNRRRKNPFDFIGDNEFEKIFDEMQRMFESTDFKDLMENMSRSGFDSNKRFIHGFSVNIGPDGKPKIQEFGNRPRKTSTDIIEGKSEVAITVEIPGVEKGDVDLNVTENTLEITVDTPQRKYHKTVDLPCVIKPKTTKATYKNGILDVVILRKDKKKGDEGFKVNIE